MRVRGRISGRGASSVAAIIVASATATVAADDGQAKPPALSKSAIAVGCGDALTLCVPPPDGTPGTWHDAAICPGEKLPSGVRAGEELRVYVISGDSEALCSGEVPTPGQHVVKIDVVGGKQRPRRNPTVPPFILAHREVEVPDAETVNIRLTRRLPHDSADKAIAAVLTLAVDTGPARQDLLPAVLPHDAPAAGELDVHALARTHDDQHDLEVGFELGITNNVFAGLSQAVLFNAPHLGVAVDGLGDGLANVGVRSRPTPNLRARFTLAATLPTASRALGPRERTVGASLAVGHLLHAETRNAPVDFWFWWRGGVVHDRRAADDAAQSGVGGAIAWRGCVDVTLSAEASIEQHYADAGDYLDAGTAASGRLGLGQWGYVLLGVHNDDAGWAFTAGLETRISLRARHRSPRSSK